MFLFRLAVCSFASLLLLSEGIRCPRIKLKDPESIVRCNDIAEAVNYLYEHLPNSTSIENKCKRYAVMASFVKPRGRLQNKEVTLVLRMSDDDINQRYQALQVFDDMGPRFMTIIDGFRASSMLSPALIELVECLKRINSPPIKKYLEGEELNLILDWYKQILQAPGTKLDLDRVRNSRKFRHAFIISLMNLFKDHIESSDPKYGNLVYRKEAGTSTSRDALTRIYERQERRRVLAPQRRREQERLKTRRMRLLDPDSKQLRERLLLRKTSNVEQRSPCFTRESDYLRPQYVSVPDIPYGMTFSEQSRKQPMSDNRTGQQSPDLAQLWSEVATVYDSIPTPDLPSSLEQPANHTSEDLALNEQVASRVDDLPANNTDDPQRPSHQPRATIPNNTNSDSPSWDDIRYWEGSD